MLSAKHLPRSCCDLRRGAILSLLLLTSLPAAAQVDWRTRVSPAERAQANPLAVQTAVQQPARQAGEQLYATNCARCHGADAGGKPGRPSLRTERTAGETDGEYYWILQHGNRWRGMPAWPDLPGDSLWQLVAYLRSIQPPVGSDRGSPGHAAADKPGTGGSR